ncbi:MAG: hypothetical protein HKP40_04295 [Litoreibacter sp.]|nr:hypothetical protein [Litoreibacter sp.]
MIRSYQAALFVVLSACYADPRAYDGVPRCGAENYQSLLGRKSDVLERVELPKSARILRSDDAISFDFSPDRLTIDVDDQEFIASVTCR